MHPPLGQADCANNPYNAMKAKQVYGSRIWLLQSGTAKDVLDEKNAFQARHQLRDPRCLCLIHGRRGRRLSLPCLPVAHRTEPRRSG